VRKCYQAPLEIETRAEDAEFVKVYDAEHGMRVFYPKDTFTVNWKPQGIGFYDAGCVPGIVADYYKSVPKGEFRIIEADAAGLQARIAASMSGDPRLRELFLNNGDFHSTNAYNMMARYQTFSERHCKFAESEKVYMEWEPLTIKRGEKVLDHAVAKELVAGDFVDGLGVLQSIEDKLRSLTGYDEFIKNCKSGRLKELRQIAKMCFAKGTEVLVFDGEELTYEKIEDFFPLISVEGVGVPYTGFDSAVNWDWSFSEILGTMKVRPKEKIEFELENGAVLCVTPDHEMPVLRNGIRIIVLASDVLETDEFIETSLT
jgi:hypothetical protein